MYDLCFDPASLRLLLPLLMSLVQLNQSVWRKGAFGYDGMFSLGLVEVLWARCHQMKCATEFSTPYRISQNFLGNNFEKWVHAIMEFIPGRLRWEISKRIVIVRDCLKEAIKIKKTSMSWGREYTRLWFQKNKHYYHIPKDTLTKRLRLSFCRRNLTIYTTLMPLKYLQKAIYRVLGKISWNSQSVSNKTSKS